MSRKINIEQKRKEHIFGLFRKGWDLMELSEFFNIGLYKTRGIIEDMLSQYQHPIERGFNPNLTSLELSDQEMDIYAQGPAYSYRDLLLSNDKTVGKAKRKDDASNGI